MTSGVPVTNQTASELYHGWMPTPNGRGTTDLLWSCLSTIFLCVWTAIHPPVPYYRREKSKRSENWRKWLRQNAVASKAFPALFSVIVPELMVIAAVGDFVRVQNTIRDCHHAGNRHLSITHSFFLNMGGFCLQSPSGMFHQLNYKDLLTLGNIESKATSRPDDANTTAEIIIAPTTKVWIRELEKLSEDDINALSKADSLTKLIACFQALWFVTQVFSRLGENQAVTLLEVSTCAYVFSAFIAYAAWWKKPQNCSMPLMIDGSDEMIAALSQSDYEKIEGTWEEFIWGGARWNPPFNDDGSRRLWRLIHALPICFGAIHVASWNTVLPSALELWMWRSSTVTCTGIVIIFYILILFAFIRQLYSTKEDSILITLATFVPVLLYVVARLFMIVEVFVSMRALPLSAYDSIKWSDAVPHI